MNRLPHRIIGSSSISRVLRAQLPSCSRHVFWYSLTLGRRYATAGSPRRPKDKFDQLFASLRPGMKEDDLAMTIAALVLSTTNPNKLERLESTIPKFLRGLNKAELYDKVNNYLENPPEDNFESIAALSTIDTTIDSSTTKRDTSSVQVSDMNSNTSKRISMAGATDSVLSNESPLDQLLSQMQKPEARRVLENLESEEEEEFRYLMANILAESGEDNMEVLDAIARFLSHHGLDIRLSRPPELVENSTSLDWAAELEALDQRLKDNELFDAPSIDSSAIIPNVEPVREMDPVELAKRVVEDESTNPLTIPDESGNDRYPDLMVSDPLLDSRDVQDFPPDKDSPYHNRVIVRNNTSIFHESLEQDGFDFGAEDWTPNTTDEIQEELTSTEHLPIGRDEFHKLLRFPLIRKRVTQQTGKGKIHRQFVLMVVGNGNGLVGYGQGKDDDMPRAEDKAFAEALRNMDWVERFENRTIWTEIETKLGATRLILRPRPVGFGLRCNPNLHQVLKAAGVKDISAKVWGSRNPINVIKAAFRVLHAGHAPLAMGDGVGGPGRKLSKGSGLRSKSDVERERGRKLISLRK